MFFVIWSLPKSPASPPAISPTVSWVIKKYLPLLFHTMSCFALYTSSPASWNIYHCPTSPLIKCSCPPKQDANIAKMTSCQSPGLFGNAKPLVPRCPLHTTGLRQTVIFSVCLSSHILLDTICSGRAGVILVSSTFPQHLSEWVSIQ